MSDIIAQEVARAARLKASFSYARIAKVCALHGLPAPKLEAVQSAALAAGYYPTASGVQWSPRPAPRWI